ncbi:MAG: response regulator transcription factor [Bryobacteraceae bacterium]
MKKITVLLADDHRMFLAGLQKLLEDEFEVVGSVGDGRELREAALRLKPDVIVADISMPLLNGIDAVRSLPADGCTSKVIFLSMHGDALYRSEAMRAGGARYILKRDAPDKLVSAIHETARGLSDPSDPSQAAETVEAAETKGITPRQREIWQLLAEGRAPKEIATIAGLSVRTVEFHKYRLMQRLKVRSGAELTVLAVKHGLVH